MALWGTGDSRWIVEDRRDGTNVNNWHWKEKNATSWSNEKLISLLKPVRVENESFTVEATDVTVTGDAACHNRKGKIRSVFDLEIEIKWKATQKSGSTKSKAVKGKVEITNFMPPNLAEMPDADFIAEIEVTSESSDEAGKKAVEFVKANVLTEIKKKLADYTKALEAWASDLILPSTMNEMKINGTNEQRQPEPASKPAASSTAQTTQPQTAKQTGLKIPTRSYECVETFDCAPADLYACFTQKELLSAFSRGQAQCETERGGRFSLYDGAVSGEFESLELNSSLVLRWRVRNWPAAIFSKVELRFSEEDEGGCKLTLTQTGIPEQQFESTRDGWTNYYFLPIRQTFGYGAKL